MFSSMNLKYALPFSSPKSSFIFNRILPFFLAFSLFGFSTFSFECSFLFLSDRLFFYFLSLLSFLSFLWLLSFFYSKFPLISLLLCFSPFRNSWSCSLVISTPISLRSLLKHRFGCSFTNSVYYSSGFEKNLANFWTLT